MKKILIAIIIPLTVIFFSSCLKDQCRKNYSYKIYTPVYKTKAEVKANIKSNAPKPLGNPAKLFILGNYVFVNEPDKGVHVIDNSNPSSPRNVAFIDIPGNMDIAAKGNILYADLYTDLVAIDISNPLNIVVKKYIEGVFPHRLYTSGFRPDSTKVITEWITRDTTVVEDCWTANYKVDYGGILMAMTPGGGSGSSAPTGIGGSMASFALISDRLYTVSNSDISVFNISTQSNPYFANKISVGTWNVETIYPFKNKLFVGSQTGMFVYDVTNPDNPVKTGTFGHTRVCDPVIADDNYAYVTLRSGTACQGFTNQLDVLQLNNITNPVLVKSYSLTNPHGLSKDGNLLFICDGAAGLKIYNAADVSNIQLVKQFAGIETYDVIAWNGYALVVAKDGLYQYEYLNTNNIHLVSKLDVTK